MATSFVLAAGRIARLDDQKHAPGPSSELGLPFPPPPLVCLSFIGSPSRFQKRSTGTTQFPSASSSLPPPSFWGGGRCATIKVEVRNSSR
ncbi:hypothetical protein PG994_010050 [Apiospora phragmitis]|uniref:Uncharacterized protein n=1 Tax=Apiospora phragmitis TaxID=2905665 RepID=A0ABR1TR16_9PEZI